MGATQGKVVEWVLAQRAPWRVLGLSQFATGEQGVAAYRNLSLFLHPDKCVHPQANDAFVKLTDAVAWAQDREGWKKRKVDAEQGTKRLLKEKTWKEKGGAVRIHHNEEQVEREKVVEDEDVTWLWMEEGMEWVWLSVLWAQAISEMAKLSGRTRVQTQLYQCDEEDSREQEMRRVARQRQRQQQKVELSQREEESHD